MTRSITVLLKRFDKTLPMIKKHTGGAVAYDVYSRLDMIVQPHKIVYIPLNIALKVPSNYWVMIAARSSLHKKGLWLANGIGVVDPDYCGDDDEYMAAVHNFTDEDVSVDRGERIAQLIIQPAVASELQEVAALDPKSRGGFGSTNP